MARITIENLRNVVSVASRMAGGVTYVIDQSYGGVRLMAQIPGNTGEIEISPRLSKSGLYEWVHAYIKGMEDVGTLKKRLKGFSSAHRSR